MLSRHEIKSLIRDLQTFSSGNITESERSKIDAALGLLYEAFAMATLHEKGINVDVANICGFMKYVNVSPLNASRSSRRAA